MKKIWLAGVGGAVAGVLVSTQFAVPLLAQEADEQKSVYEELDLFGDIFERIRSSYVEPVEDKVLIEAAINGMLTHLDPHSSYMPSDEFDDMRVQTKGEFGGLGIEVTQENGVVKVVSPIEGTPADRAGRAARRLHHRGRRRERHGADARRGGGPDARAGGLGHHHHPAAGGDGRSLRREDHPRDDHHLAGEVAAGGRGDRAAADHVQRADLPRAREAARGAGRGRGRHGEGDGLRPRPQEQPRRAPEPGDLGGGRLHRVRARSSRPAAATRATASATTRRRGT